MQILHIMNVILKEPQATEGSHGILRYAHNDNKMVRQSGNAVLIILLGVALFGALSYTFMRGSQTGQGNLTHQKSKLLAEEIINYASLLERTVNKLRQNGCSENEISFDYDVADPATGYENLNSPLDFRCHVFHSNGGKISPPEHLYKMGNNNPPYDYHFIISRVDGLGTDNKDLIWTFGLTNVGGGTESCLEINKAIGIANSGDLPPGTDGSTWTKFTGSYSAGPAAASDTGALDGILEMVGKEGGCYLNDSLASIFYKVLIVR